MKNKTKKLLITTGSILALMFTFAVGVYAAEYITWDGTVSFKNTSENHKSLGDNINGLFTQRDELQKDLTTITTERDGLVTERDGLIEKFNNAKGEDEEAINSLGQLIANLNAKIDSLESQIAKLNEDIETKDAQIATLTEKGQTKDATITTLQAEKTTLTNRVSELETDLTAEKAKYDTGITTARKEVKDLIHLVNDTNGKGPRYDVLKDKVNEAAALLGVEATTRIDGTPGNGPQDKQLEQALKDVKKLEQETIDLLEIFKLNESK